MSLHTSFSIHPEQLYFGKSMINHIYQSSRLLALKIHFAFLRIYVSTHVTEQHNN